MCESSVLLRYPDGHTEKIADDVLIVAQDGDMVVLRWFLAEPRRIMGTIREVDAIKHVIILSVAEAAAMHDEGAKTSTPDLNLEVVPFHHHPHPH